MILGSSVQTLHHPCLSVNQASVPPAAGVSLPPFWSHGWPPLSPQVNLQCPKYCSAWKSQSVLLATQEQQNEWLWPPWDLDCGFQRLEFEGKFAAWSFRDSRQSYADKGKCALQYEHRVFKSELYTHWEGEEHESWVNPPNEHWIFAFP